MDMNEYENENANDNANNKKRPIKMVYDRQTVRSQNSKRNVYYSQNRYMNDNYSISNNYQTERQRMKSSNYMRIVNDRNNENDCQFQQTFKNYLNIISGNEKDVQELFDNLRKINNRLEEQFNVTISLFIFIFTIILIIIISIFIHDYLSEPE